MFKSAFPTLDISACDLVRLDLSSLPEWVQEHAAATREWALEQLEKQTFPREDYHELLLWTLWHLGVEGIPGFFPLRFPGPDHQARWMSKAIGYPKIYACSSIYPMPEAQLTRVKTLVEFIVVFYVRAWLEAPLAATAARSDLNFMKLVLMRYKEEMPALTFSMMAGCYRQLWYLTAELVVFALADRGVSKEEREKLAQALFNQPRKLATDKMEMNDETGQVREVAAVKVEEPEREEEGVVPVKKKKKKKKTRKRIFDRGGRAREGEEEESSFKPDFPYIPWDLNSPAPHLSNFVTPLSWTAFDLLGLSEAQVGKNFSIGTALKTVII